LAFLEIPWVGVKSIRKAFGGTVNDVVLSALGGALAAYAEHYGESIQGRTARIAVPVNVRRDSERAALGNRISMLAVEVPLDAAPVERLRAVVQNTDALKRERTAEGVGALMEMMGVLSPNALKSLAATLAMPNGISNAVCTNVPGPVMPLYTVGRRLLTHYAVMPIAWDMGVGCAVMSYHGHLYLTLVADTAAMGDVKLLREMMHRSFAALYRESAVPDDRLPKAEETEARVVAA
jgi:hypothetical protein